MATECDTTQQEQKTTVITQQNPTNWVEDSKPNPNLPHEIIFEILLRLHVKSLLQCMSVSKSWCSLISSPQFAKTHLNVSTKDNEYAHHRLILRSVRHDFEFRSCSLCSVMYEHSVYPVELDNPLKNVDDSVWIVGSCHGLICLATKKDPILLWNPSTRQSRRLPNSGIDLRFGGHLKCGFGYDEFIDDYIVVRISCFLRDVVSYDTEVKVYRSRRDSWRKIQDFPYGIPLDDSGKFGNGALHWIACSNISSGPPYSRKIVALDLVNETYREVLQPSYGEGKFNLTLGFLGELLCVLCNYRGTHADVWVMKDYGVRESWTKMVTLPYRIQRGIKPYSMPLCITKSSVVLLVFGLDIIVYYSKDNSLNYPHLHNFVPFLEVHAYVESLISPNIHASPERQQQ